MKTGSSEYKICHLTVLLLSTSALLVCPPFIFESQAIEKDKLDIASPSTFNSEGLLANQGGRPNNPLTDPNDNPAGRRLRNRAYRKFDQGKFEEAIELAQKALRLYEAGHHYLYQTVTLRFIGDAQLNLSQYEAAIETYERAFSIATDIGNRRSKSRGKLGLAEIYMVLGDYRTALNFAETGIQISSLAQTRQDGRYRRDQARGLRILGRIYTYLGDYEKAIEVHEESLRLAREIPNSAASQARSLHKLGIVYNRKGDYAQALTVYEQALIILREDEHPQIKSRVFGDIAALYLNLGDYQKAIDFRNKQIEINRETGALQDLGNSLGGLGTVYQSNSDYYTATNLFKEQLEIMQEIGDRRGEASALGNLGSVYQALGVYSEALNYYERSLAIFKEIGNKQGEAEGLSDLGFIYSEIEDYDQAIVFLEQSLNINREMGDRQGESTALNRIGVIYNDSQKYKQSVSFLEKSLTIAQEIGNLRSKANALGNLGIAYHSLGDFKQAIDFYQQSLIIKRKIGDRAEEGWTLSNLGRLFNDQNEPNLGIIFLKASVEVRESIRGDISKLDNSLQKSFADTVTDDYRLLAELLLNQGRLLEAQQVLDLLKAQELNEYLRGIRGFGFTLAILEPEREILERYGVITENAITVGQRLVNLRKTAPADRSADQQSEISRLVELQEDINRQFREFAHSKEVTALLQKLTPALQDATLHLTTLNRLRKELPKLNAALLTPLILDDRLEIILTTPDSPPIRRTVSNLTKDILNDAILELRQGLTDPNQNPLSAAQQLYDALIRPIEEELSQSGVDSIIYAPDGQLRYVPLSVLHNGESWLIQTYHVNNITAESLSELNDLPAGRPSVLAGAFADQSIVHEVNIDGKTVPFNGLPFAGEEVNNLEQTFGNLTKFEDSAFSLANVKGIMNEFNILHFATHAAFVTSSPEESFILFGNGDRPNLLDIENWSLENVDLVVLSACETGLDGFGNGAEILGMGYQFQVSGAGAVMASLWSVDDRGTQDLMDRFYHHLSNGLGKAEALQRAQADLIMGDGQPSDTVRGSLVPVKETLPESLQGLRHPYYWAPFILIGNGL